MLKTYLTRLHDVAMHGDAREESFYAPLSELLSTYEGRAGLTKIKVTTLPKQTEAGNPDFRVWDGKQHIVGYIEAKEPNVEHLDRIFKTAITLKHKRNKYFKTEWRHHLDFSAFKIFRRISRPQ